MRLAAVRIATALLVLAAAGDAAPPVGGPVRVLPRWLPAWSDGCSVPALVRPVIPSETEAVRVACTVHDEAYYYGGSEDDRRRADERLRTALIAAGMAPWKARVYYVGVRLGGGPEWRIKGVSWSFGGEYFQYSDRPAVPDDRP
jgi:hypothetical protein